jgi:hypothetical protein
VLSCGGTKFTLPTPVIVLFGEAEAFSFSAELAPPVTARVANPVGAAASIKADGGDPPRVCASIAFKPTIAGHSDSAVGCQHRLLSQPVENIVSEHLFAVLSEKKGSYLYVALKPCEGPLLTPWNPPTISFLSLIPLA